MNKVTRDYMLFGGLISALTAISILNNLTKLSTLGLGIMLFLSAVSFFCMILYLTYYQTIPKIFGRVILFALVFISINFMGIYEKHDLRFFITIYQFISLFIFFMVVSCYKWKNLKLVQIIIMVIVLINLAFYVAKHNESMFSGIYNNPNSLGAFMFIATFFIFVRLSVKKSVIWYLLFAICIFMIIVSDTRSALLSLVTVAITYLLWGVITKSKKLFKFYFISIIVLLLSFSFFYPRLIYWGKFYELNSFVLQYTGKSLYTGRELIWIKLLDFIKEKPFWGYGAGTTPADLYNIGLSSHNLFFQITLQSGIFGIVAFLLFLYSIWKLMWLGRKNIITKISASFFIGILVQQCFEVILTQNNMSFAYLEWLIIGIGVSYSYHEKSVNIVPN